MTQEFEHGGNELREALLEGRTPLDYILSSVEVAKANHKAMHESGHYPAAWSEYNLAETLCGDIAVGIITEEEMERALPHLGLNFAEARKFLEETIGQSQALLELKNRVNPPGRINSLKSWW